MNQSDFQRCWLNGFLASENVLCLTYIIRKLVLLIVKKDSPYVQMWFNPLFLTYLGQFTRHMRHIHWSSVKEFSCLKAIDFAP